MSTWFAIPSGRPAAEANEVLVRWRAQGYKIALWRDTEDNPPICDLLLTGDYPGYYAAVNALCREVLAIDESTLWISAGGDDTEPDPNKRADEIAAECTRHFGGTFGVMQPCGDPWAGYSIERICGSPFMGREFCTLMYQGKGPFCDLYYHMWGDEEMQEVTKYLGVLWQRRDLCHMHHHWQRNGKPMPEFLRKANESMNGQRQLFVARRAAGFPGHAPLSVPALQSKA